MKLSIPALMATMPIVSSWQQPLSHSKSSFHIRRSESYRSATTLETNAVDEESVSTTQTKSRTQRIMESTNTAGGQTGGAGGSSTWDAFLRTEENWKRLKASKAFEFDGKLLTEDNANVPDFVTDDSAKGNPKCWAKLRE